MVCTSFCMKRTELDVQVLYIQRILFNELATALDVLTHQRRKDLLTRSDIFELHLHQGPALLVPTMLCVAGAVTVSYLLTRWRGTGVA